MAYHHLVMTAGTSAVLGKNLGRRWLEDQFGDHVSFVGPRVVPRESVSREAVLERARTAPIPPIADPKAVSAEYSLVAAVTHERRLVAQPHIDLVHTATFEGELAAIFCERVLVERGATVVLHPVADMDPNHPDEMRRALGGYLATLVRCLQPADPRTTGFAPIGGYKIMTSLGTLAGALFGFGSFYLHEDGQKLVRVPAVPLDVRPEGLTQVRPVYWRIRDAGIVRRSDLGPAEQTHLDDLPWLFDQDDELVGAGPFAELLLASEQHGAALRREVFVEAEVAKTVDPAELRLGVGALIEELDGPRRPDLLFHEATYKIHGTPFHAFRTRTDGRFRLAWRLARPDRVEIRRAWVHDHDRYEDEVQHTDVLSPAGTLRWVLCP